MKILKANVFLNKSNLTKEEWEQQRRNGIGGSDAPTIVGFNPYSSLFSLYADKLGITPPKEDNERMRQGRDLEQYVIKRFREHMAENGTPKKTKQCNYILQHPEHKFMLANIDGLIVGENAGLECKTTSVLNLKKFRGGEYPEQYYPQCLHYMAVTGAKKWYLAVLILNDGFKVFEIERDENEINLLIQAEKDFWENNVLKQIPPPVDGSKSTSSTLNDLYTDSTDSEINLTCFNAVENLMELKKQKKFIESEITKNENIIKSEMKEFETGFCGDCKIVWKSYTKNSLDLDRLKAEHSDIDLNNYYETTSYKKFTLSKINKKEI